MMWFLLFLYIAHIEPVILQGNSKPVNLQDEDTLILRNGSHPCEGHVEIYHNGKWGYVGTKDWDRATEEVVCRSTHCGKPKENSTVNVLRPIGSTVWLNELKCNENDKHLWDCSGCPGWNISFDPGHTVKRISCTSKIKISLDGHECAGAVQYSIDNEKYYFCDNWGQKEAHLLCKHLNCGEAKEIVKEPWMGWKSFESSKNKMTLKCASGIRNDSHPWQCAKQESQNCRKPASVICTDYKRLQLKGDASNVCSGQLQMEENGKWTPYKNSKPIDVCRQMNCGSVYTQSDNKVTCTDNVKVVLRDKDTNRRCYGEVHIQVNASTPRPVCANEWTKETAQVVCTELKCGKVVSISGGRDNRGKEPGIMDYVKCSGKESSLWHCRAKHAEQLSKCDSIAYVVCEDSIEVRLADGPGKCAGRVEIKYEDQWKRVSKNKWAGISSDVVCKQLKCGNERKSTIPEKFSKGSGDWLAYPVNCITKNSNINECIRDTPNNQREEEALGITCEEHKVVFLENSCSGKVGIEHGTKVHWLSGSNETWNQNSANTVCQQMHCGKASQYNFINWTVKEEVWNESYSCSPNTTSLFECEKRTLPSDHSDTIATVTCSGKIKMNLTNRCWGRVNVCVNETCGGLCGDTWTDQMSLMLCKDLGCGDAILTSIKPRERSNVIFQSLHTTNHTTKVNQCNFVKSDKNEKACDDNPAYVVCSGCIKAQMSSRDKCSGNVQVHYEGKWLPVCTEALKDKTTQDIICGGLDCGPALKTIDYFGPKSAVSHVISKINCPANGTPSLAACKITSVTNKNSCTLGGLQCTGWSEMQLGGGKTCSGNVLVHSKGKVEDVSPDNWTETKGNTLCQDLECGNLKSSKTIKVQQKPQIFLECEGDITVNLSDKCHGVLKIKDVEVCSSSWTNKYSHLVCQEQNCSNAVVDIEGVKNPNPDEDYHHVRCEDYHSKLGQCNRFKEKCKKKLVSVYCTKNVKFNTTEKCGGQIEVNYRNKWEKVCGLGDSFSSKFKEMLCKELNCGGHNSSIKKSIKQLEKVTMETQLHCTEDHMDIKHCVIHKRCASEIPAEIYCNGYAPKPMSLVSRPQPPIVPIILGVGFLLVLVIVIVVFVRICIVKKAKNVTSRMLSRREVEFESGDYEDVKSKENEMEDFGRGRFTSEAEAITESDARSNASFPYDDIDEAAEARPLTSQAATAGPSDEVTYEVEDPQENYDDIEASPEITQTKVEVHDSPQPTPESVAAVSPALVQEDEDYLVPGQDG